MMTNETLQKTLKDYPEDCTIAISIEYNGVTSIYTDIKVEGIQYEGEKFVLFFSGNVDEEYETLINGGGVE